MESLSLVLPAYNEAGVIYEAVREAARAMEALGRSYEIVVVDDGSTDETPGEIDRAVSGLSGVKVVTIPENTGKGNALKRGFQASTGQLVCFLDSDLDIHPYQVQNLLSEMDRTGADVVIGSKRHPRSRLEYPRIRRFYSSVYYYLIFMLFRLPVKDTQTGIKLFRREVLASVFPRMVSMQYVLDLELLLIASHMGYRIVEAPVRISFQRQYARIASADIRGIIADTMSLFYRFYVLGYYGSPLKSVVDPEPRVSIVIPTRDIDPMVSECVRRCSELNYSNFDIKLVPDSPADIELPQRASRVIPSGPIGPAEKRNMGAADSDAEIIAFIDGDAYPDHDWLKNAVPYFDDEGVTAVGGPAVTPAGDSRRQQASGMVYSAMMVSGSTTYRYRPHAYRVVNDYPTSNLLVRHSDFDSVGGFDEQFWPGEDTVLCLKLTRDLNKRIEYVPNVVVNHHRRPVFLAHLRQVYSYALHRGFFVRKFPETSRRFQYFVPSLFVLFLVGGLIASLLNTVVMLAYLSLLGLYLLLTVVSSIKGLDPLTVLLVVPGIPLSHVTYGVGFIIGLLSRRMREQ
jgi:glycosyltransferase involved in cell wall biosynthesis